MNAAGSFREYLDKTLAPIAHDMGFRERSFAIDDAAFGNAIAIFESDGLLLEFVTDQGDLSILVKPENNAEADWVLLTTVLYYIDKANDPFTLASDDQEQLHRLQSYYKKVRQILMDKDPIIQKTLLRLGHNLFRAAVERELAQDQR